MNTPSPEAKFITAFTSHGVKAGEARLQRGVWECQYASHVTAPRKLRTTTCSGEAAVAWLKSRPFVDKVREGISLVRTVNGAEVNYLDSNGTKWQVSNASDGCVCGQCNRPIDGGKVWSKAGDKPVVSCLDCAMVEEV